MNKEKCDICQKEISDNQLVVFNFEYYIKNVLNVDSHYSVYFCVSCAEKIWGTRKGIENQLETIVEYFKQEYTELD